MSAPAESSPSTDYKYWAFISYSHQDNLATRADGTGNHVQWANWLHEQLETYRIPDGYRDRATRTGEPMPERFFPAFRDEAELPTSHDLGGQIRDALRSSRFLIVIASPRSARSRYVNEEVRYFRELGRGDRILTLIIDGEPNVRLTPKPGWPAEAECFCPALVHPLHPDGRVNESALLLEEPIAADVRVKEAEPAREMRTRERDHSDRRALLDFMKFKLLAGLMGVGLDELVQRDKRRTEEELRRVRREASHTEFLFARQLLDLKEYPKAYARLAKAIEMDPDNRAAVVLGLEEVRRVANPGALRQHLDGTEICSAVFSPDGTHILTASRDTTQLWHAVSGQPLARPRAFQTTIRHVEFSPQGLKILVVLDGGTVWLGRANGDESFRIQLEGEVTCAKFSMDGCHIILGLSYGSALVWDASTGESFGEPLLHRGAVFSAQFSPEGSHILTASWDKKARIWDAVSRRLLIETESHDGENPIAVFSPDGTQILTFSDDGAARLWNSQTGDKLTKQFLPEHVTSAVFSPDGTRILTTCTDQTAMVWGILTGEPLFDPLCHEAKIVAAKFTGDGTRILTASGDGELQLWDSLTGNLLSRGLLHGAGFRSASFSPDGSRILTRLVDGTVRLWNASTNEVLAEAVPNTEGTRSAVFSPDGRTIVTASNDKAARCWSLRGEPQTGPLPHASWVLSAEFSPDGSRIVTASADKSARLWDAATGNSVASPMRHEHYVGSAVFSPDGTKILTASWDRTARIWDAGTGQSLATTLRHEDRVLCGRFSQDGSQILTASSDRTARLWNVSSGELLRTFQHEDIVNSVAFSPNGLLVLTASNDCTARLWDRVTGLAFSEPLQHEAAVTSAVFSPDNRQILTASCDTTIQLWDAISGQPISQPLRTGAVVTSVAFNPTGSQVVSSSVGQAVRIWDATTGTLTAQCLLHLCHLLEIIGGRCHNERGLPGPIPPENIRRLREDFKTATGMDRLLLWWWSDPFTRCIHPSSQITVPNFVRRNICGVLDWSDEKAKASALREARAAFPHHPLVLLCLAGQGRHGDSDWLAQFAVSRLLEEPHYHMPLPPPRNDTERAARAHELSAGLAEDCVLAARLLHRQQRADLARKVLARAVALRRTMNTIPS